MTEDLVSIIIRTKNEERWIGQCLDAISKQTYKNFEIILVDNLSHDKTVDKANDFGFKTFWYKDFDEFREFLDKERIL